MARTGSSEIRSSSWTWQHQGSGTALMLQQAVNARTLAAAEGGSLSAVAPPTEKPAPADWAASAGFSMAATAASELAELHAWLGRDSHETEKDWDPVAH